MKQWIERGFADIPQDAKVIEIGSGTGRDADYIEGLGYRVERTDAVDSFINYLKEQGHEARKLNVLTDAIGGGYDVVFADAVMLHFTAEEFIDITHKIYRALNEDGRFVFCVKAGEGDEWTHNMSDPRFFHYWKQDDLNSTLESLGFSEVEIMPTIKDDARRQPWLLVIAVK